MVEHVYTVNGCGNTIVVADGSGSMTSRISKNSFVTALDVANVLAIYFAERSSGQTDPYACLLQAINAERYQPVEDALRPVLSA